MPITITNTDGGLGYVFTGTGTLTDAEFLSALGKHLGQDAETFQIHRYALLDWTGVTGVGVSPSGVKQVASLCLDASRINPDIIVAEVADKDLAFGMVRMAQALRDRSSWENMAFRDRKAAEEWLRERVRERFGISELTFS